jgi:hypothetical protein
MFPDRVAPNQGKRTAGGGKKKARIEEYDFVEDEE